MIIHDNVLVACSQSMWLFADIHSEDGIKYFLIILDMQYAVRKC